jgi:fibronectin-binding autotransporter adhesin
MNMLPPAFPTKIFSGIPALACLLAMLLCWMPSLAAQTTYTYGNGTTTNQLTGNWNDAGRWSDGTNWGNWVDGGVAQFFSPAAGANASITLGSAVSLSGLTKNAEGEHFTAIAQAGHALNFADNSTISVNRNTLAFQAGAISGNNLLVTGASPAAGTAVRFGPGGATLDANANTINGLTLENVTLKLSKDNGVAAVGGAVVVNSGVLEHGVTFDNRRNNKYAAGSSLTLNGGTVSYWSTTQALDSFTYNGGIFTIWANANMNLGGTEALTLRNVTLERNGGSAGQRFFLNLTNNGAQTVRFDAANNGTAVLGAGSAFVFGGGVKTFNVENGTATTDMQVLLESISETESSSIRKTGAGVVAWNVSSATNTYSGGMTVEQGALFFTRQAALPSSGVTVSNGATLGLRMYGAEGFTESQFTDLHAGTLSGVTMGATAYAGYENTGTNTLGAVLTGTRGLTKLGGGNLTLTGNNLYTGGTFINQGSLQIGDGGTSGAIVGNVVMANNADSFRQLIFNRSDNLTFAGEISGGGSLRKEGAGTLTLTGNNTYNNTTTVAAGVLELAATTGGAAATTSAVSVATNAVLLISQSDQVRDAAGVTLSGGTIQRGSGVSEVFGNLNLTDASFLDFGTGDTGTMRFGTYAPSALLTVNNFLPGNKLQFGNSIAPGDLSNTNLFSFSNGFTTGTESGVFTITAIPEPSTYLAAVGLLAVFLWPARRRLIKETRSIIGLLVQGGRSC